MKLPIDMLSPISGLPIRSGKAPIRPQAVRLWWSDEARLPQEGQDNQEGRAEVRMHELQNEGPAGTEAVQAL